MKALIKSFGYAFQGIFSTIRTERNMRIHLTVSLYMYGFLLLTDFFTVSRTQFALLFLANAIVMMGEIVNTAVEAVVDLVEKRKNELCKIAKDAAAGAVLVGAIFALAVGIAVLWQPEAFKAMAAYYTENPLMLALLAVSVLGALFFIFKTGNKTEKKSEQGKE